MTVKSLKMSMRTQIAIAIGVAWMLIGFEILLIGTIGGDAKDPSLFFAMWPLPLRSVLWLAPGAAAIVTGLLHPCSTKILGLLWIPLAVRMTAYFWAWLQYVIPGSAQGLPYGWIDALLYSTFMVALFLIGKIPGETHEPEIFQGEANSWKRR